LKIAECLGRTLNDFSACYLTTEMCCATEAKDENKDDTVLHLFHKYLGTSILLVRVVLLILFHNVFVIPVVPQTTVGL
jgi:hypothetical protein